MGPHAWISCDVNGQQDDPTSPSPALGSVHSLAWLSARHDLMLTASIVHTVVLLVAAVPVKALATANGVATGVTVVDVTTAAAVDKTPISTASAQLNGT